MLERKIDRAIEKEAMRTGKMGTEPVTVEVKLTSEENEEFKNLEKYDSEHYFWEIEDNTLRISYTEEIEKMKKTIDLLNEAVAMGISREQALADIDASLDAELEERQPLMEEEIPESLYNDILDGFVQAKEADQND